MVSDKTPSVYSDRCKVAMHLCALACWQFMCNCLIGLLCLWPVSDNTLIFSTADKLNEHMSAFMLWMGSTLRMFAAHLMQREPTDAHLPLASLNAEVFAQLCPSPLQQKIVLITTSHPEQCLCRSITCHPSPYNGYASHTFTVKLCSPTVQAVSF